MIAQPAQAVGANLRTGLTTGLWVDFYAVMPWCCFRQRRETESPIPPTQAAGSSEGDSTAAHAAVPSDAFSISEAATAADGQETAEPKHSVGRSTATGRNHDGDAALIAAAEATVTTATGGDRGAALIAAAEAAATRTTDGDPTDELPTETLCLLSNILPRHPVCLEAETAVYERAELLKVEGSGERPSGHAWSPVSLGWKEILPARGHIAAYAARPELFEPFFLETDAALQAHQQAIAETRRAQTEDDQARAALCQQITEHFGGQITATYFEAFRIPLDQVVPLSFAHGLGNAGAWQSFMDQVQASVGQLEASGIPRHTALATCLAWPYAGFETQLDRALNPEV